MVLGFRDRFPVMTGKVFSRGATLYSVHINESLGTSLYTLEGPFLPNVDSLSALSRFRTSIPPKFPAHGTAFRMGLSLYHRALLACGQWSIARTLLGLIFKIDKLRRIFKLTNRLAPDSSCDDDFYRKCLKKISGWAFPRTFSLGPAYSLLMHLENLGGPSPWTKQQIIDDITAWVSGGQEGDFELLKPYYDKAIAGWGKPITGRKHLKFKEFCNDQLRWGTSGGARAAEFGGRDSDLNGHGDSQEY